MPKHVQKVPKILARYYLQITTAIETPNLVLLLPPLKPPCSHHVNGTKGTFGMYKGWGKT